MTPDTIFEDLEKYYGLIKEEEISKVFKQVEHVLDASGIQYRVFHRIKKLESIKRKMERKAQRYINEGKKMQDILGIRVVLYFIEDIPICIELFKETFRMVSMEYDKPDSETFRPQRINMVFSFPDGSTCVPVEMTDKCLIDNTFELQIRTIFSEGWHEVEHDVRYKYKNDWEDELQMSRDLNGIFAVLEMCDNNMVGILDNVAYSKYKKRSWEAMMRNRFRLRFTTKPLSSTVQEIMDEDQNIAKSIFRFSKVELTRLFRLTNVEITFDNAVFLINAFCLKNRQLEKLMSTNLLKIIQDINYHPCEENDEYPYRSIVTTKYV